MAATISTLEQKGFIILQQDEHETLGVALAHLEGAINFKNVAKQRKLASAGAARDAFKAIMAKLLVELDVVGNHVGSATSFEEAPEQQQQQQQQAPSPLPELHAVYSRHSPVPPTATTSPTNTIKKPVASTKRPASKKPAAAAATTTTTKKTAKPSAATATNTKKRQFGDTAERAPAAKRAKPLAPARKLSAMKKVK